VVTTAGGRVVTQYAAVLGMALAVVAVCLSAVSLGLHWLNRDKHPEVQALHTRCDQLQLAQTDMLDRIEHWTRRDRVRRLREGEAETAAAQTPTNDKSQLRAIAKAKGVLR